MKEWMNKAWDVWRLERCSATDGVEHRGPLRHAGPSKRDAKRKRPDTNSHVFYYVIYRNVPKEKPLEAEVDE